MKDSRSRFIATIVLAAAIGFIGAFALDTHSQDEQVTERWDCYDFGNYDMSERKLGTLTAKGNRGTVDIAGIVASTQFAIYGLQRRWDWGPDFEYAIVMKTDGVARFYDFRDSDGEKVPPSDSFRCKRP